MNTTDFQASAELYLGSDWQTAAEQGPRSFRTAANAIRFAFEEAAPVSLRGAQLRVGGKTYSGRELFGLYASPSYPLGRKPQPKPATRQSKRRSQSDDRNQLYLPSGAFSQ